MANFEQHYAPACIAEIVYADDKTKATIIDHLLSDPTRPLLLHGLHGNGKTTIARAATRVLQPNIDPFDILWLDADCLHDYHKKSSEIESFASTVPVSSKKKVVIMDEFDNYSMDFQRTLKGLINRYQNNIQFIFTTNHVHKIDEGILSRSLQVEVAVPEPERWVTRFKSICKKEGVLPPSITVIKKLLLLCASGREVMAQIEHYVKQVQAQENS